MINFKFIVTAIFSVSIVAGIAVFAMSKGFGGSDEIRANLVVWGTISADAFNAAKINSSIGRSNKISINYVKKDIATFDSELIEALADGVGPDIVLLRDDSIYKQRNKLFVIPYENYTEREFKDKFLEEGELFLSPEGVVAVPFIVDPLVMYWNRDLFRNALIAQPPVYWDEVFDVITKVTKKDNNANVLQSTIALGEWSNITNAKEIISTFFLQAGNPITKRGEYRVSSTINDGFGQPVLPSLSAVNFYTQFSNPTGSTYTWNRSLPTSQNFFLSGNLAMYLGFASELFSIQQKNSNLNFDVTYVPQVRNTAKKIVFAHMYALAIVKQSKQITGAYIAINALTEAGALKEMEKITTLPPVRRDLLSDRPSDAYRAVFYNSALISDAWIDPDTSATRNMFRDMVESVTSGKTRASEAVGKLNQSLDTLFQ